MYIANVIMGLYGLSGILITQSLTDQTLFEFNKSFDIPTRDAKVEIAGDINALRVTMGHTSQWPGFDLNAPDGKWDLSKYKYIKLQVKNLGSKSATVHCRVDNPGTDGVNNCISGNATIPPGEKKELKVNFQRKLPENLAPKVFGMRGYPGGLSKDKGIDPGKIEKLVIYVTKSDNDHIFEISNIQAGGEYIEPDWISLSSEEFFPMIDEYGQFIHKDWPGKTKSMEDFTKRIEEERIDINEHPGPQDFDVYGGWKDGPKLESTGYFRVEKYNDKWWLVDPDGRLFWSHGIDCVHAHNATTPISEREYLYKSLPEENSTFAQFYGAGSWAPHNYYEGKTYRTYNFTSSNLLRKYGENWKQKHHELAHIRIKSWGMNTIANWSDNDIYIMRKTPYVVSIGFGGKMLEGSQGYWGKFRDVFDSSFKEEVRKSMSRQQGRSAGDPWCIGYFVDNEIAWGDEVSLAIATLLSPPEQPAKGVFIEDLKAKYNSIENLNKAWDSQYASWDDMLQSRKEPDRNKAYEDLTAFYTKIAEAYFRICRDAVKEFAPDNLYLGCRFAWGNNLAVQASAKYCDVVSYNFYRREIESFRLPEGLDKPVIVGEFHFGALDRGMFHTGLVPTENQDERAKAYKNYVTGGLKNPWIVGTHWFQFGDQATTGRGDGENYQIGFLDVADTPYPEIIQACREVGYDMYKMRYGR